MSYENLNTECPIGGETVGVFHVCVEHLFTYVYIRIFNNGSPFVFLKLELIFAHGENNKNPWTMDPNTNETAPCIYTARMVCRPFVCARVSAESRLKDAKSSIALELQNIESHQYKHPIPTRCRVEGDS
jgi:hypothetical protein